MYKILVLLLFPILLKAQSPQINSTPKQVRDANPDIHFEGQYTPDGMYILVSGDINKDVVHYFKGINDVSFAVEIIPKSDKATNFLVNFYNKNAEQIEERKWKFYSGGKTISIRLEPVDGEWRFVFMEAK